ncbi:MAG: hypothetical protein ACK6BG_12235 [Cyanobacteriota bacterium]
MNERNENLECYYKTEGRLAYCLAIFGDHIARREGYKSDNLQKMDAVYFYLIHKHNWLPRDVKSMSYEDLRFVLDEEMQGWSLPEEAR